jgi:hypothetical protein
MTITTTSRDASGKRVINVGVYRKTNLAAAAGVDLSKIRTSPFLPEQVALSTTGPKSMQAGMTPRDDEGRIPN